LLNENQLFFFKKGGMNIMSTRRKLGAITVALLILFTMNTGKASAQVQSSFEKSLNIIPERNEDGNYNIIFITTDQERYFEAYPEGSAYRARELLASLGTTFEKHYCCATMSTSSRSVIFTGQHINRTGMIDNIDFGWQNPLSEEITTVGDRMRQAGYYSALKGKWHMGDASLISDAQEGITDLTEHGFSDWGVDGDYIGGVWDGYEKDGEIVNDTIEWLEKVGLKQNEQGRSFFLAVNLINPHDIMCFTTDEKTVGFVSVGGAPNDILYTKTYQEPLPVSMNVDVTEGTLPEAVSRYKNYDNRVTGVINTPEDWKTFQEYYFNCIQDSDNHLMDLLQSFNEMGLLNHSIIIFTSDHGEMGGAHGLKGKGGLLYEENLHVPLVIYHPDYEGGNSIHALTSHIDLAPTFIHMTGLSDERKSEISRGLPGKNLMPLIEGTTQSVRSGALFCSELISTTMAKVVLGENRTILYFTIDTDIRGLMRALITERYKFARYFSGDFNTPTTFEALVTDNDMVLYDLKNDPLEQNNLASDPLANKELIMEMNTLLNQLIAQEMGIDDGAEFHQAVNAYRESLNKDAP